MDLDVFSMHTFRHLYNDYKILVEFFLIIFVLYVVKIIRGATQVTRFWKSL